MSSVMSSLGLSLKPAQLLFMWMLINVSESRLDLFAPDSVTLPEASEASLNITLSSPVQQPIVFYLNVTYTSERNYSSIITLPTQVLLPRHSSTVTFNVTSHNVGQVTTYLQCNCTELQHLSRIRFMVIHSNVLAVISQIVGWLYFLLWSLSFYPQAWENWRRKSVIGLNFDFLALNLTGFIAYTVFNVSLFWVPFIQEEFLKRNPKGINPVSSNDVFFSLHAVLLCLVYFCQAAIYKRGDQKISWTAVFLLLVGWTFALVTLVLAAAKQITWLDFLYYCSYIKLAVTLIKYVPQAFMNYRRQSTEGWSIGGVLMDFSGGILSILQMFLQSYNNNEWKLVFGDPTKFGLGAFSVIFDILFLTQHYCLYRKTTPYEAFVQDTN
eukprot:XP_011612709.1 PREDICTED: cystinosin isoform X1 [Takifugu rubripes]